VSDIDTAAADSLKVLDPNRPIREGRSRPHDNHKRSNLTGEHTGSTAWWNDVPRGTMDEVSSQVRLNLPSVAWQGRH
jgi:hypothetical protein